MKRNIIEAAKVIRSKNSGPYELTFDIMFKSKEYFEHFKENKIINKKMFAELYKIPEEDIMVIVWFAPANAVKVTIKRPISSGAPGETDIYGAQQHAPLFNIEF
ncbi:MAG: DUF4387 domain-containing protein [Candidatus Riflebacteria bacterium]|jgi:hypothetical protein|nr:DUF4387 domain-containing protein [Candidatus Riflebacteria bacterium]